MKPLPKLPLPKQLAYATGQLGWSTLINIVNLQLVYFYIPPSDAGIPGFITQAVFLVVLNTLTLIAASGRLFDA
ncbi:MAG: MFS transporter, partial [Calditrichaeota bacterium]|nr:MFS transporter [Calditrichota bacterium]